MQQASTIVSAISRTFTKSGNEKSDLGGVRQIYCFSPNSTLIGIADESRTTILHSSTLEIIQSYNCADKIDRLEFSPDSQFILCAQYGLCCVQVFSVSDGEWRCRINDNMTGLTYARWCPDSQHILTCSDFALQLSIWSLSTKNTYVITYPKQGPSMLSFSDCGRYAI